MLVEFDEEFAVPVGDAFTCFHSPADWPRQFGASGDVEDRGGGWHAVARRGFPLPLVAMWESGWRRLRPQAALRSGSASAEADARMQGADSGR